MAQIGFFSELAKEQQNCDIELEKILEIKSYLTNFVSLASESVFSSPGLFVCHKPSICVSGLAGPLCDIARNTNVERPPYSAGDGDAQQLMNSIFDGINQAVCMEYLCFRFPN
jgi:hypothetical protein